MKTMRKILISVFSACVVFAPTSAYALRYGRSAAILGHAWGSGTPSVGASDHCFIDTNGRGEVFPAFSASGCPTEVDGWMNLIPTEYHATSASITAWLDYKCGSVGLTPGIYDMTLWAHYRYGGPAISSQAASNWVCEGTEREASATVNLPVDGYAYWFTAFNDIATTNALRSFAWAYDY